MEKAIQLLKSSKRGKLPIVNGGGELVALATRALFKEDARMPLGGECRNGWCPWVWLGASEAAGGAGHPGAVPPASLWPAFWPCLLSCHTALETDRACPQCLCALPSPLSARLPGCPAGPASVAPDGRLLVGAAVGTRDSDKERVKALR